VDTSIYTYGGLIIKIPRNYGQSSKSKEHDNHRKQRDTNTKTTSTTI